MVTPHVKESVEYAFLLGEAADCHRFVVVDHWNDFPVNACDLLDFQTGVKNNARAIENTQMMRVGVEVGDGEHVAELVLLYLGGNDIVTFQKDLVCQSQVWVRELHNDHALVTFFNQGNKLHVVARDDDLNNLSPISVLLFLHCQVLKNSCMVRKLLIDTHSLLFFLDRILLPALMSLFMFIA